MFWVESTAVLLTFVLHSGEGNGSAGGASKLWWQLAPLGK